MAHAHRQVLLLHGDVLLQVRVDEQHVRLRRLDPGEQRLEVVGLQLEWLVEDHLEGGAMRRHVDVLGDAQANVLAVRRVFPRDRDAQRLGQRTGVLLFVEPAHQSGRELLGRGGDAEQIAEPALVQRAGGPRGGDVRHLQLLGRRALGFDDRGGEAAEQEVHTVLLDQLHGEIGGALTVRAVIDDLQTHGQPPRPHLQAAFAHHFGERQRVSVADPRSRLGLPSRQGQRCADDDLGALGFRGFRRSSNAQGQQKHSSWNPEHCRSPSEA